MLQGPKTSASPGVVGWNQVCFCFVLIFLVKINKSAFLSIESLQRGDGVKAEMGYSWHDGQKVIQWDKVV